jgi:hypothetical protein
VSDGVFLECIQATVAEIGKSISGVGFPLEPTVLEASTDRLYRWIRRFEWKTEIVQASHKQQAPRALVLSLAVEIPCRDGADVIFDGRSIEAVLGKHGDIGWLPQVFTRARCTSYGRELVVALRRALVWFDEYPNASVALERLRSGATNHGLVRGRAFQEIEAFLERAAGPGLAG